AALAGGADKEVRLVTTDVRVEVGVDELLALVSQVLRALHCDRSLSRASAEGDRVLSLCQRRQRTLRVLDVVNDAQDIQGCPLAAQLDAQPIVIAPQDQRREVDELFTRRGHARRFLPI